MRKRLLLAALVVSCCGGGARRRRQSTSSFPGAFLTKVQMLAFNDFHGHLEPPTPGRINDPVTGASVLAGGVEYLATHMKALGSENGNTFVVGGRRPDRRRRRSCPGCSTTSRRSSSLNLIGTDYIGVGNHEFDEGVDELLRMQYGGCHPVDGCQDGTPFVGVDVRLPRRERRGRRRTRNPILPPLRRSPHPRAGKVAFIGETFEDTPLDRHAVGRLRGLDFLDEADTANALVPQLKAQGVETIVLLLHQGGFQTPVLTRLLT